MKSFLRQFILFLMPLVILLACVEVGLLTVPNTSSAKLKRMLADAEQINVLILGASDADSAINPEWLDVKGMNMAGAGRTLYYDAAFTEKYLPGLPSVRVVVLPVTYFSMEAPFLAGEPWRAYFYSRFYGLSPESDQWRLDLRKVSLIALYGQRESLRYSMDAFQVNLASNINSVGWNRVGADPAQHMPITAGKAGERARFLEAGGPSNISANVRHLKKIANHCQQRGIQLLVLRLPVTAAFREARNPDRVARDEATLVHACADVGVLYRDFSSDSRFSDADFFNVDHLDIDGARRFTRILNDEVLKPLLSGNPAP